MFIEEDEGRKYVYLANVSFQKREMHEEFDGKTEKAQHIVYAPDEYDAKDKVREYLEEKLKDNEYYTDLEINISETIF